MVINKSSNTIEVIINKRSNTIHNIILQLFKVRTKVTFYSIGFKRIQSKDAYILGFVLHT